MRVAIWGAIFAMMLIFACAGRWSSPTSEGPFTLDEIVTKLESGELKSGSTIDHATGKTMWLTRGYITDNATYSLGTMRSGSRFLSVYLNRGQMYAACLLDIGGRENREIWYFSDSEKLATHIKLATEYEARRKAEQQAKDAAEKAKNPIRESAKPQAK